MLQTILIAIVATSVAASNLRKGALDPKVAIVGTNFDTPVQVPLRNKKSMQWM